MGFIVTDGADVFSEEKRGTDSGVYWLADGVPASRLVNTCRDDRYGIGKEIVTDPRRDTPLQQAQSIAQQGALSDYHLCVLLAPHLGNHGSGNTARVDEFEGMPLLFAQRNGNIFRPGLPGPLIMLMAALSHLGVRRCVGRAARSARPPGDGREGRGARFLDAAAEDKPQNWPSCEPNCQ